MFKYFSFKRLWSYLWLLLAHLPIRGHHRWVFLKMAGVQFKSKRPKKVFIYGGVLTDTMHPEYVHIGDGVALTSGVKILTHYLDPSKPGRQFRLGEVHIGDNVFIGMNVIVCNSVTIGEGSIIGAGSVVTKDIPANQVWAGNPARYIKDRVVE